MSEKNTIVFQSEGTFNPGIILNESNYDVWSQLVEMHIAEREKLSYIRGKINLPKESKDGYEKWYAENQKVKRWLLMSMSPEIMKHYLHLPTAQEIWSALSKAFYDGSDELQVFTLNQKAFTAKQNSRSLFEYYGELTEIFCELDHWDKVVMKDPEDIAAYRKSIERQRVHIFLAGFGGDFEQVRGEILRKDPLPDLEECYALIRREAVRHASMKAESDNPDTSAMVVRQQSTRNWQDQSKTNYPKTNPNIDKSTFKCTHYNKAAVAKIKTEANVDEKASALVAATDYGDKSHPLDLPHKKLFTQPMYNAKVRVLRSDNGGEYQSFDLQKYLEGHGSIHQTTCSNTPQQNGVAERENRQLLEVVHASLIAAKILISYWGEAIRSTAYLINRVPSSSINFQTPFQALTNAIVAPTIPNLPPHVFSYVAFVHLHKHQRTKLTSHALQLNKEAGELDMSGQQFGSEDVFTEIPNQSSSVEGVLNLEPDPFMKRLPHHHNKAIPNSVQEALADPRWKAAMNEEMKSLQNNETWELVECPPGKKPVGCRWIYTVKYKADAANLDWPLQQFDVKNVFLHGELSKEVYMDLPPGCMVSEKQCQKVCKLKKSLYGLKQSPRAWFARFTKLMRAFCYRQSNSDHTLFLKKQHGKITTLIVYVDDMVVTRNDPEERKALQNYISREFEMKDLGPLKYFLRIEVSRSSEGIFLSQRKYALDLLQETGMSGCQPVNTPIEEGLKLCVKSNQVSTDKERYQRLVGRLMYLAHTRPDLAYALSVVSQYMHNLGEQHMNAVMRILRRSTSGYFTFVSGNLVTWKSKKQNVVTRSSAEAEFRGMALGLCEALWLRLLLQDLGYLSRQPIRLFCENKAACDIANNLVQHDRTKHVEVDRFFIKEKLDDKIVELPKIRSEDQLADILTKAVSSQVEWKVEMWGVVTGMIDGLGGYEKKEDWIIGEMGMEDGHVCMIPMHVWSFRRARETSMGLVRWVSVAMYGHAKVGSNEIEKSENG
ncbi:Retrovirus-related Pol polyprotein from transposon RE1 [Vitis vinifera]|uniref:Retrovirus-related Pol polyprotein from transposon RE1 n=1 Tax=Vitis vinifera TaxID=29760 RepID=A0A438IXA1_VITVI|nr:Retrovirus-related Pol polyprotein from transposon RE1 [Vitis vinifera]